jgi:hypothetical protein
LRDLIGFGVLGARICGDHLGCLTRNHGVSCDRRMVFCKCSERVFALCVGIVMMSMHGGLPW